MGLAGRGFLPPPHPPTPPQPTPPHPPTHLRRPLLEDRFWKSFSGKQLFWKTAFGKPCFENQVSKVGSWWDIWWDLGGISVGSWVGSWVDLESIFCGRNFTKKHIFQETFYIQCVVHEYKAVLAFTLKGTARNINIDLYTECSSSRSICKPNHQFLISDFCLKAEFSVAALARFCHEINFTYCASKVR